MILDVERKFDSHLGISAKDPCPCFSFKCFFSKLQEFRLFPGRFLQIYCKELAKLDHAGDNYGEVAEDLCDRLEQEHTPPNFIHQSRSPTIHITKNINTFFPKNISKISKINSRMIFIQKYPRNYCSISSQIAYKFLLCFFVKMCFAKLHFLTVHLQTSHSISI